MSRAGIGPNPSLHCFVATCGSASFAFTATSGQLFTIVLGNFSIHVRVEDAVFRRTSAAELVHFAQYDRRIWRDERILSNKQTQNYEINCKQKGVYVNGSII